MHPFAITLQKRFSRGEHCLILVLGDSITECNHCSEGYPNYVSLLGDSLRLRFGAARYAILNAAFGGAKASLSVDYVKSVLDKAKPDFAFVMFGMNDSGGGESGLEKFSESMLLIAGLLSEAGAATAFLTQNPIDFACASIECIQLRRSLPDYMERVRKCASASGAALIDIEKAWREEVLNLSANEHFKLLHDGIHPNHQGHKFIFKQIEKALFNNADCKASPS